MLADDGGNIARREIQLGHLQRIEDDPHAVVLLAEHQRVSDTLDSLQIIDDPQRGVVGEKDRIVPRIGRLERHHQHQIGGHLLDRNALPDHFRRKLRLRQFFSILGLDLGDIGIGSDFKRELDRHMSVVAARRLVVEQIVHAGKRHLNRTSDRFRCHFRAGTGIVRIDLDHRRSDFRELRDRQKLHGQQSHHDHHDRDHRGKNWPVNKCM